MELMAVFSNQGPQLRTGCPVKRNSYQAYTILPTEIMESCIIVDDGKRDSKTVRISVHQTSDNVCGMYHELEVSCSMLHECTFPSQL